MPHYAAGLTGAKNVLEDITPCFNTPLSTIRCRGEEWIMESSNFERCESIEKELIWRGRRCLTYNNHGRITAPSRRMSLSHLGTPPIWNDFEAEEAVVAP